MGVIILILWYISDYPELQNFLIVVIPDSQGPLCDSGVHGRSYDPKFPAFSDYVVRRMSLQNLSQNNFNASLFAQAGYYADGKVRLNYKMLIYLIYLFA